MIGYISYPQYPKSFKAKRRLFPKVSKHKINEYIQLGVKAIILEHELGRGKDEMTYTYGVDNVEVKITYKNGDFHAYVKDGDKRYDSPIETKIQFDYAENQYDRDYRIMEFTEDKCKLADETRRRIEESSKMTANLIMVVFLLGGLFIGNLIY